MESGAIKRRLTAILAADAVGYSRHMSVDEEGTMRELAAHRAVIDRIIDAREGRIVGTAGDSVLAEFASPVEAVRCAVEIQEAVHTRNETLPEASRLLFRIGVNLGDVMIDGADILGDGVNVASRLEGIADPGGILISSSVYDQVAGKLLLGFEDMGERSLKNISRPIRVYRFDSSGARAGGARSVGGGRRLGFIGGGLALIALVAAGLWQTGIIGPRPASKSEPPAAALAPVAVAPAPAPAPAPASEEMKLKLQIAEAERAKAEAELAKARSEAESAKQRTDAESARQRAAVKAASAERKDASPPPPTPQATAIAALVQGRGVATRSCDGFEELKGFVEAQIPVRVEGGEIVIERGTKGMPGFLRLHGRPDADGQLILLGTGIAASRRSYGNEMKGTFTGVLTNGVYELKGRMGQRACTVSIRLDGKP